MGEVISQIAGEDASINTLLAEEICSLTYEQLLVLLGELNILAKKSINSSNYRLVFAVKNYTDTTPFWKATIQIACVKLDTRNNKVLSYRLLSLSQFLKVFKTFKCQVVAAEQSKHSNPIQLSELFEEASLMTDESPNDDCTICFERKQDTTLPCAHSFCSKCIDEWSELHDTCPICRERLESPSDAWVISEVPNAEEISNEIMESMLELTGDKVVKK